MMDVCCNAVKKKPEKTWPCVKFYIGNKWLLYAAIIISKFQV